MSSQAPRAVRPPALVLAMLVASLGCTTFWDRPAPHKPVEFGSASRPAGGERFPHWMLPPATTWEELDAIERQEHMIRESRAAGAGTTGARDNRVYFPELGEEVRFKTKVVPSDLDGINNAPRKELAAYWIQTLFLDPEDFVVPTTFAHCVLPEEYSGSVEDPADPNLKGADCVLVVVALWLEDVTVPDVLYDEQRFLTDPVYAYYMSNLNVFTFLIKHQDGRRGNFIVSKDDARRQVFAIDNGSTFDQPFNNWFVPNWNLLRVAAVRQETVDRLRALERSDLDTLLVVSQLELREDGHLEHVRPGPSLDDSKGALRQGNVIQFGLTRREIDRVWERMQALIAKVDSGELPVF